VHHCASLSSYVFATKAFPDSRKKNLLNSNNAISLTCPHSMVNFGLLTAEISWQGWGTLVNFNRFSGLASLLHRQCLTEVNQTLHDVWPSPALVCYVYIFGGSLSLMEFCQVQNSHCVQVLCSPIWQHYCTAFKQWVSAKLCGVVPGME